VTRALYRKYRSKSLDEIVGQSHVTDILARSLAQGRVAHAYLLTGPRGVGKTSIARILAYEINKLPYNEDATNLDIIEIDAASNNGVEDVRELREKVQIAPVSAAKKIYIIDEVHMLSKAAFNALLKTLEEPPEHAVFILATTDADKLPQTIISRTQRFHFRAITPKDAASHLKHIAKEENIKISDEALKLIAVRGDGSFRDSISLLDQLSSLSDKKEGITPELVERSLGLAPLQHVDKLLAAYEAKDLKTIIALLDESDQNGTQSGILATQLIQTIRETIAEKPQFMDLLDQLLDVAKSSQPDIKLLTILASHAAMKPKTAALVAPPLEVSASVAELEKQTNKPVLSTLKQAAPRHIDLDATSSYSAELAQAQTSSSTGRNDSVSKHETTDLPLSNHSNGSMARHLQPESEPMSGLDITPGAKPSGHADNSNGDQNKTNASIPASAVENFDWQKLIEYTRTHFVAIYSVLSKCGFELEEGKLILYTGNAFYKKKLDDAKYRGSLIDCLVATGVTGFDIETIGTPPPPKDSTAAAVAAIMGGGEEVTVDA